MKLDLWKARHPFYTKYIDDWSKCRDVYEGGDEFIERFLTRFSKREDEDDFKRRKAMSYNPGFAATIVDEIKNSIYLRMPEITRKGGDISYSEAIQGKNGGVDLKGASLNNWIGQHVLPEILVTSIVGVYVDMPDVNLQTLADVVTTKAKPYLYFYQAEQIYTWNSKWCDGEEILTDLVLHETYDDVDPDFNVIVGQKERLRRLRLQPDGVLVEFYKDEQSTPYETRELKGLRRLPFIMAGITKSILRDIANYQIALLNIESSDLQYITDANFTFYVEPYDPRTEPIHHTSGDVAPPEELPEGQLPTPPAPTEKNRDMRVKAGPTNSRRYPMGANAPEFISPSSEPLKASMDKQAQMKTDMRKLANLALTSVEPKFASAESKQLDDRSLESGLSYIGLELERLERMIGEIWNYYMKGPEISVKYPRKYSLKTDKDRREDAKANTELATKVPSKTFTKEMGKVTARMLLEQKVSDETLKKIDSEIDKADFLSSDAESIAKDVEAGLVSKETASNARGYDGSKEVPIAKQEHTERLAEIAAAQAPQGAADGDSRDKENKNSQQTADKSPDSTKAVRGDAK